MPGVWDPQSHSPQDDFILQIGIRAYHYDIHKLVLNLAGSWH